MERLEVQTPPALYRRVISRLASLFSAAVSGLRSRRARVVAKVAGGGLVIVVVTMAVRIVRETQAADERLALYTLWLMLFTGALAVGTGLLWWTTRSTLKHLNREFLATHRPTLVVRSLALRDKSDEHDALDWNYAVEFRIVNIGESAANLVGVAFDAGFGREGDPLPPNPLLANEPETIPTVRIEPGASIMRELRSKTSAVRMAAMELGYIKGNDLQFFGRLVYLDENGTRRETGFAHNYNFVTERFTLIDDADYQYRD